MEFIKKIQTTFQKTSSILLKGGHSPPFGDWAKPNCAYPPRRSVLPLSANWRSQYRLSPTTVWVSPFGRLDVAQLRLSPQWLGTPPFGRLTKFNTAYPRDVLYSPIAGIRRSKSRLSLLRVGVARSRQIRQKPQKSRQCNHTSCYQIPCEGARGASSPSKGREKCRESGGSTARRG